MRRNLSVVMALVFGYIARIMLLIGNSRGRTSLSAIAAAALALAWLAGTGRAAEPEFIKWDAQANAVTADIRTWTLEDLLKKVSTATGWKVFVEPGTERNVSAKFEGRTPDKALDVLLGDLSRVLLPQEHGPAHFLVFRTVRQNATREIEPPPDKPTGPIPNELVVTLEAGAKIDELAAELGAKVIGAIDGKNAYRLQFEDESSTEAARKRLEHYDLVDSVENNYPVHRDLPMQAGSFAPSLNLRPGQLGGPNDVVVALLDTALQPAATGIGDYLLETIQVAGESYQPGTFPLHGDVMSQSILQGLDAILKADGTTQVRLQPYDVYGNNPATTTFTVAEALYHAWKSGADIVNMSFGSAENSPILYSVVQGAAADNVLMFAAAGNEPVNTPSYPAAYPEVIAVSAGDQNGTIAPFANYGSFVEIVGPPGTRIIFNGQSWMSYGTSVSSATVSGIAAGMMQTSGHNPSSVATQIRQTLPVNQGAK